MKGESPAKMVEFRGGPIDGDVRRVGPALRYRVSTNAFAPERVHIYARLLDSIKWFSYIGTVSNGHE